MPSSLRSRLLVWYTVMLATVITLFGAAVCYLRWRSLLTEIDVELASRAGTIAAALRPAEGGTFDLDLPREYVQPEGDAAVGYAIWSSSGALVDRSDPDLNVPLPVALGTTTRNGRRETTIRSPHGATILVSQTLMKASGDVRRLGLLIAFVGLLAIALAIASGWLIVGRALAPIGRIARTAHQMIGGDHGARISLAGLETELDQVARALNEAFDRLLGLVEQERRFTADASHELRTPLATLAAELEWARARDRSLPEYRESLDVCHRAVGRMQKVVENLLMLSRADAGEVRLARTTLSVDAVVREAAALVQPLADRRGVTIDIAAEPVTARGDADWLTHAITNVLANAIQYNRDGGRVDVSVSNSRSSAMIEISDTGIGIAPEDVPHVFERFFRTDRARTSDRGGIGLGLALSQWIVQAHGGDIRCTSELGTGTRFTITL